MIMSKVFPMSVFHGLQDTTAAHHNSLSCDEEIAQPVLTPLSNHSLQLSPKPLPLQLQEQLLKPRNLSNYAEEQPIRIPINACMNP